MNMCINSHDKKSGSFGTHGLIRFSDVRLRSGNLARDTNENEIQLRNLVFVIFLYPRYP